MLKILFILFYGFRKVTDLVNRDNANNSFSKVFRPYGDTTTFNAIDYRFDLAYQLRLKEK